MSHSRYRLSPLAETDLEDIWLYTLETWSLEQADRYLRTLFSAFADLAIGRNTGRGIAVGIRLRAGPDFAFGARWILPRRG